MLISAVQQHESALDTHTRSLRSIPSILPPPTPLRHHRAKNWAPGLENSFPLASSLGTEAKLKKAAQSCLTLCNPIQSMDFSRPEHWRGLPLPSPGDLPKPGVEPGSPALQADYDRAYVGATPSVLLPSPTVSTSSSCFIFLHSIYYCLTTHTMYISDNTIYIFFWLSFQLTNPKPPMIVNSMRGESLCVFLSPPNPSS